LNALSRFTKIGLIPAVSGCVIMLAPLP